MEFLYAIYQNFQSVKIVKKNFLSFGCHLYLNASFVGKILKDPLKLFGLRKAICCVQLAQIKQIQTKKNLEEFKILKENK